MTDISLNLNDMLAKAQIDPAKTLVMRHRPQEPLVRKLLPQWVGHKRDWFEEYQSNHAPREERQLQKATHLASFFGHEPGKALFLGLYQVQGSRPFPKEKHLNHPMHVWWRENIEPDAEPRWNKLSSRLEFNLQLQEFFDEWRGRLEIGWQGGERSWSRWSSKNDFPIRSIWAEAIWEGRMPPWDELVLLWDELQTLPAQWRNALSHWRGIYLIFDVSDGSSYIGSAYGQENLLGRWLNYAKSGHGGNRELRQRNPAHFRFSILERVSPDLPPEEVIAREVSWKIRLHTREFGLNAN